MDTLPLTYRYSEKKPVSFYDNPLFSVNFITFQLWLPQNENLAKDAQNWNDFKIYAFTEMLTICQSIINSAHLLKLVSLYFL